MTAPQVDEALRSVRELKWRLIDQQLFRGYSGTARVLSGIAALGTAIVLALPASPKTVAFQLGGWAVLYTIALFLNLGALFGRFLATSKGLSDWVRLRPVLGILPPFVFAGALTLHFVVRSMHSSLFGMWMGMYGLMHLASRSHLPRYNEAVGWFYLATGIYFLGHSPSFMNPWPMGIVFFLGETAGGLVFCRQATASAGVPRAGE